MFRDRGHFVIRKDFLDRALKSLPGHAFKMFAFLWSEMLEYEESGTGYPQNLLCQMEEDLCMDAETVISALIYLRRYGWIDILALRQTVDGGIMVIWIIDICRELLSTEELAAIECRNRRIEKEEGSILAGLEWGIPEKKDSRFYSQHFRDMRPLILQRDGNKCTECDGTDNLHVHHLTYEHEGTELMDDLITLCRACHSKKPKQKILTS